MNEILVKKNPFYMAGTEGTGAYVVVAVTPRGRIGFRVLAFNLMRVRIEPADRETALAMAEYFPEDEGWKPYGFQSQPRYSRFGNTEVGRLAVARGLLAIGAAGSANQDEVQVNDDAPGWAKEFLTPDLTLEETAFPDASEQPIPVTAAETPPAPNCSLIAKILVAVGLSRRN